MGWGLEIGSEALRLCCADLRRGRIHVRRVAEVAVPSGLIHPSVKDPNLRDAAALSALLLELGRSGGRRGWVRLALPDPAFSLRTIATDELPAKREEARKFLRWQLRHLLPFPAEEARLDFLPSSPGADGRPRVVCLVARERILAEYEQALAAAGLRAAVLDARSISLAQAAFAELGRGTAGLLAVGDTRTTLLLVQEGRPRFWRILPEGYRAWVDGDRTRLVREVAVSITFCQESEGMGAIDRLTLDGLGALTTEVASTLTDWLELPVTALDLGGGLVPGGSRRDPAGDLGHWGPAMGAAIRPC